MMKEKVMIENKENVESKSETEKGLSRNKK